MPPPAAQRRSTTRSAKAWKRWPENTTAGAASSTAKSDGALRLQDASTFKESQYRCHAPANRPGRPSRRAPPSPVVASHAGNLRRRLPWQQTESEHPPPTVATNGLPIRISRRWPIGIRARPTVATNSAGSAASRTPSTAPRARMC